MKSAQQWLLLRQELRVRPGKRKKSTCKRSFLHAVYSQQAIVLLLFSFILLHFFLVSFTIFNCLKRTTFI